MKTLTLLLTIAIAGTLCGYAVVSSQDRLPDVPPQFGGIAGRVLDAEGLPISGAKVSASVIGQPATGRRFFAHTDEEGRFFLNRVSPGMNVVRAFKVEEGYPDSFFAFYAGNAGSQPHVIVSEGQIIQDVVVQLGPRAGRLRGSVIDADTNRQVENAQITLYRADNPAIYFSFMYEEAQTQSQFQVLVPPIPFRIRVSAPGYENSDNTSAPESSRVTMQIDSGSIREILVPLRRRPAQGRPARP